MKTIVAILALAIAALATSAAFAVEGDRGFYYAESNEMPVLNEVLARLIEASLKKDMSGNTLISAANCAGQPGRRGCATPRHFLEAYREIPELKGRVKLDTFDDLLKFIRELKKMDRPAGTYEVASLRPDTNGSAGYRVVMDGVKREFKPDEKAWVYEYEVKMADGRVVKTQVVVMTSECANAVKQIIRLTIEIIGGTLDCVYIPFTTKLINTVVRFSAVGPADIRKDDDCLAVKAAGDIEFKSWWTDYCVNAHCDFSAPAAVVGQQIRVIGSYEPKPGEHVLRLPRYFAEKGSLYVTLLCIENTKMPWPEKPSGVYTATDVERYAEERGKWIAGHSDTTGVRWHDYREVSDRKEARVYYSASDVPPGLTSSQADLHWHWGRWEKSKQAR
ncbi:MAG: hypothetical protein Q8P17_03010 [bacterium]|nr:hypothetical protein [bacterium]